MRQNIKSQVLSYWLQYLMHIENLGIIITIGIMSMMVGLIALSFQYLDRNMIVGFFALVFVMAFLIYLIVWMYTSKKSKFNKAKCLIDGILKCEITDYNAICDEWYKERKANRLGFGFSIGMILAGMFWITQGKFFEISTLYICMGIVILIWNGIPYSKK